MASAPVGSSIFAVLALLCISGFVLLLLRSFLPLRKTPNYLLIPVFLSLVLPISIILLVPIDLASSAQTEDVKARGIWLPAGVLLVAWRISYWLTFALTWLLLPLLGEYIDSGYRTPKDRMIYSLKSNGQFYLIVIALCGLGLVYVIIQNGFDAENIKGLVMALAYCVGLVQAIYQMGHGLVAVPRRLLRDASAARRLHRLRAAAPRAHEKMDDALVDMAELDHQLAQLVQRKNGISRDHQEWVEELIELTPPRYQRTPQVPPPAGGGLGPSLPAVITDRYLAEFGRKLTRTRHRRVRFVEEWERLVEEASDAQAVIDSEASGKLEFPRPLTGRKPSRLSPRARYWLCTKLLPAVKYLAGGVFALASVCVIWSEIVQVKAPRFSLVSLSVITHGGADDGTVGFGGQTVATLWIVYMCAMTLMSFRDVKLWGNRALVWRNTYGESATFYGGQVAKLTVPLTYNFLTFFPARIAEQTVFHSFLGTLINLTPLGEWFITLFPLFILVPVCAALFNLYGRIQKVLGLGLVEDDDEEDEPRGSSGSGFGTGTWREGRSLIEREIQARLAVDDSASITSGLLGLDSDPSPSTAGASSPPRRSEPTLYIPPAPGGASYRDDPREAAAEARRAADARRQAARMQRATAAAEEEDESVFAGFAHRVRNTLDSVERPGWLAELGQRPKWLGGDDEGGAGGSGSGRVALGGAGGSGGAGEESGRAEAGRGLGRWFGGRPADGRLRI